MLCIIANETSGNGAGAKALKRIEEYLNKKNAAHRVYLTTEPYQAKELADDAYNSGCTEMICLGGDGTISETVNGLAGRLATLYFVPCGTGNDFVRMLDLPKDPLEALIAQLNGKRKRIDVGQLNDRFFLNVSGSGFDVEVLKQADKFKKIGKGILPYLLGILKALFKFKPLSVELIIDGVSEKKKITIISVGNGRYFGGGMKAVPNAIFDDGLFDVVIADKLGKLSILRLLKKFISGKHISLPCVNELRCRELTINCPGMTLEADGELMQADTVHYEILPGALEICMPVSGQCE